MSALHEVVRALRRTAGRAYRGTRNAVDALLHSRRRRAARGRVAAHSRARSILVVCYGNICRSPYLEALLRRDLPTVEVSSAGFVGPGRRVPAHSTTLASRERLDLSNHRSRMLSKDIVRAADLVVVMDVAQANAVVRTFGAHPDAVVIAGDLDPAPIDERTIFDPWGKPLEAFEMSFVRLARCAKVLVGELTGVESTQTRT